MTDDPRGVPGSRADGASGDRRAIWVRQTAAVRVLETLVSAVGVHRILPVKGVVTARTLYADPAERSLADVDVRVADREVLARIVAFAKDGGHRVVGGSVAYDNVVVDVEGVDVDVECHVGPPGLSGLSIRAMLERSTLRDDVFGFPCAIPELHDHAVLLAVNAFKDKLVTLQPWSVEDLLRIATRFVPATLAERAHACRSAAMVWIVADWLAERSSGWRDVRDAIGARPPRRVYTMLYRWLAAHAASSLPARVLARAGSDDVVMRMRALRLALTYARGG